MNKEWFIAIGGRQEGPYSIQELKGDERITPDTLVWKKGFKDWIPLRHVAELNDLFKDKPEGKPLHEQEENTPSNLLSDEEALTLQPDPYSFLIWLLIAAAILIYVSYLLFYQYP